VYLRNKNDYQSLCQWEKSPKKQSVGVYFVTIGSVFWVPN